MDKVRTTCRCQLCRERDHRPKAVDPVAMPAGDWITCRCGQRIKVTELRAHQEQCKPMDGRDP